MTLTIEHSIEDIEAEINRNDKPTKPKRPVSPASNATSKDFEAYAAALKVYESEADEYMVKEAAHQKHKDDLRTLWRYKLMQESGFSSSRYASDALFEHILTKAIQEADGSLRSIREEFEELLEFVEKAFDLN